MKTKGALLWGVGEEWSVEEIEIGDPRRARSPSSSPPPGLCHSDEHLRHRRHPGRVLPRHRRARGRRRRHQGRPGGHRAQGGRPRRHRLHPRLRPVPAVLAGASRTSATSARTCWRARRSPTARYRVTGRRARTSSRCACSARSRRTSTVHQASVVKIEPDIPLEMAALVGCGVTTGWGSATKVADVRPGETVVVIGAGGVGMNAVQGAAAAGAKRVMAIDPVAKFKREWAHGHGRHPHLLEHRGGDAGHQRADLGPDGREDHHHRRRHPGRGHRGRAQRHRQGRPRGRHRHGQRREHRRQAQPLRADPAAEGPAGRDLRRPRPAQRHPRAALALPGGPAQARRAGDHEVLPRGDQPGVPGHARRQEHPRR